jgi:hypothetical protein
VVQAASTARVSPVSIVFALARRTHAIDRRVTRFTARRSPAFISTSPVAVRGCVQRARDVLRLRAPIRPRGSGAIGPYAVGRRRGMPLLGRGAERDSGCRRDERGMGGPPSLRIRRNRWWPGGRGVQVATAPWLCVAAFRRVCSEQRSMSSALVHGGRALVACAAGTKMPGPSAWRSVAGGPAGMTTIVALAP